jgi:twitching motility protein PilT
MSADSSAADALDTWLTAVRRAQGSDLLLVAGRPPMIRARGALLAASADSLSPDDIARATIQHVPDRLRASLDAGESIDLAFSRGALGRFRMNLHLERGRLAAAIRALPTHVPSLGALGFSHDITLLGRLPRGLVLVCGPTGSGKTTTVAAIVAELNATQDRHIVTIEDPVEYEHAHGRCVVEQIEIGADAPSFPVALRAALRQAPDVLVIGEMRDTESIRIAVTAAETGHLVIATVHSPDVAGAVSRVADAFPAERQNTVRQELAMGLSAILVQALLPSTDGGVVPAAELLVVSYGARQHIRKNALQNLHQEMTSTRKLGSFTFEDSLAALVRGGRVERATAMMRSAHPDELDLLLQQPRSQGG